MPVRNGILQSIVRLQACIGILILVAHDSDVVCDYETS